MAVDVVAAINNTNFVNLNEEQRNYFIQCVQKYEITEPPQQFATLLANIVHALRTKIVFERFSVDSEVAGETISFFGNWLHYKWNNDDQWHQYAEPFYEQILQFVIETLKVGPRAKHVLLWGQFFDRDSGFKEYVKNMHIDKWRSVLNAFRKKFTPVEGEDSDEFYRKVQYGLGLFISIDLKKETKQDLAEDYSSLYFYYEFLHQNLSKKAKNCFCNLASQLYQKCGRNPIKNVGNVKYLRQCLKMFGEMLNDPSASVKKIEDRTRELINDMKDNNVFEEMCGDTVDFVYDICNRDVGPPAEPVVECIANYWYCIKGEKLEDKKKVFNQMALKFTELLESLDEDTYLYCSERLVRAAMNDVLIPCANSTKEQQDIWVRMSKAALSVPGNASNYGVYYTLRDVGKHIKWKDYKEDCKIILELIMAKKGSREESKILDDLFEEFLKNLKKVKLISWLAPEIMDHSLTIIEETEIPLFESVQTGARSIMDVLNIKEHRTAMFDTFSRLCPMLKYKDYPWTVYYSQRGLGELGGHCIKGLKNVKALTEGEIKILMDFSTAVMDNDLMDPEENKGGGLHFDLFCNLGPLLKLLTDTPQMKRDKKIIPLYIKTLNHDDDDVVQRSSYLFNDFASKGAPLLAPYLADILECLVEKQNQTITYNIPAVYEENPEPMKEYFPRLIALIGEITDVSFMTGLFTVLAVVAKKQPMLFSAEDIEKIVDALYGGELNHCMYALNILQPIAAKRSHLFVKYVDKFVTIPINEHYYYFLMKILGYIAARNGEKIAEKIMNFFVKFIKENEDVNKKMYAVMEMKGIAFKMPEVVSKHRPFLDNLVKTAIDANLKDQTLSVVDILEGRSLESLADDLDQQQEDIDKIDKRVTTNEKNIKVVKIEVINQKKDIKNIKKDVKGQGTKLNELGEVVEDTVKKVEEIDQKTLSHAPYWSKDVSKLLNPKSDTDWRLLSSRLGYSKDDIRAWAQQADPCMAMLNEWYTTHKTSEANSGVLTALQEMNRMDAALFIENGMKATEQVVEDEDFEYSSPPPIFLSYQWGHQEEVKLLRHHLELAGYDCWMDIGQMGGGDKLFEKIDKGIRSAKIIISCTTEKYAKSPNCNREVNLSVTLKKPIIPLLLEDCPWPPEGSMGPIFSEYLYIQFFQRDKSEATTDDRFWPIPKFQELLMQLSMNGIVPDESKVFKLYRNWWKPLVEEIKVDKSKTFGGGKKKKNIKDNSEQKEDKNSPEIFISYQWDKQKNVMLLYKRLTELGYHCWMDIHQMGGGDSLYDKIDRGIRGCQVVLSCVTEKYSLSANCRREVSLCDSLKRSIIPLLLENMTWPPKGPMSMAFTELLYIDFHSDKELQEKWTGQKFDEMRSKIRQIVPNLENELLSKEISSTEGIQKSIINEKNMEKTEEKIKQPSKISPSGATNVNSNNINGGKQNQISSEQKTKHQSENNISLQSEEPSQSQSVNQEPPPSYNDLYQQPPPSSNDLYQQEVHPSNTHKPPAQSNHPVREFSFEMPHQSAHVPNSYYIKPQQVHQPLPGQYHQLHPQQYPQQQYPQQPQQYYQPQQPQQYHQPQQYNRPHQQPQYTHQQHPQSSQPRPSKSSTCSIL